MSNPLAFTIPGNPRGKGRPRATRFGAGVRLYTDAKTASYEGLVAHAAHVALGARDPLEGALEINVLVRIAPPASASKKAVASMLAGEVAPAKKPDLDNIVKAVLDGCNGVAFKDDAQICWINAGKIYAAKAGVDVTIRQDAPSLSATLMLSYARAA
ncbi:RusA family crossover junction endodeoxyribonuclease [Phenylobacterium immobile]|uniref:RusA family crossover junction endodeoxyribonuclease n=1 Tax=Phenylobacterium immobile TaxID=21 RepID=UPI000B1C4B4B|nr:RusA family crossover junction endodeoxyribonuclease [Phenylobacterium immobile]